MRNKAERLGRAFADGVVSESAYRSKFKLLKKEETSLIKRSRNIDIEELGQIVDLGIRIDMVEEALSKGPLLGSGDYSIVGEIEETMSSEKADNGPVSFEMSEGDNYTDGLAAIILKGTEATWDNTEEDGSHKKQGVRF